MAEAPAVTHPPEARRTGRATRDLAKGLLRALGLRVQRVPKIRWPAGQRPPDHDQYDLVFQPWRAPGEFRELYERMRPFTLVVEERAHVLFTLARQALALGGEFWECGVYRGGTAMLLAEVLSLAGDREKGRALRLFDTFAGMPETDPLRDVHRAGDFADTSLASVRSLFQKRPFVSFHPGFIPESFAGLEDARIAFAHVDVDLYRSVLDCCAFLYPRTVPGGFLVFDDYGFPSCPGARQAVDEFFLDLPERPLVLPTGQAIVFRSQPSQPGAGGDSSMPRSS